MLNWLHTFNPQPVLWQVGSVRIYWYGLLITLAGFICLGLGFKLAKKRKFNSAPGFDLYFYLIFFGIIGARIWHVLFYSFDYFRIFPLEVFKVWQGGLAIQGAIAAGLIVVYFYAKKRTWNFWQTADLLAVALPLGQAIGRWGNYFNQELYGLPCQKAWCIPVADFPGQYFQPVFLYESILNLSLFLVLWSVARSKINANGLVALLYLIGYSIIRFFMEFLRTDAGGGGGGLNWVQWLGLVIIITGITLIYKKERFKNLS